MVRYHVLVANPPYMDAQICSGATVANTCVRRLSQLAIRRIVPCHSLSEHTNTRAGRNH